MKLHLVLTHPLSSATLTSGPTSPSDSDEPEPDKQRRGKTEPLVSRNVTYAQHKHFYFCKIYTKLQDEINNKIHKNKK